MSDQHSVLWEQFNRDTLRARKLGNFSRASRILKEALREAEEYDELPKNLIDNANSLAELYMNQQRFADAESLYRSVLELREKLLGPTHKDVVDSLKKLAVVQILSFRAEALGKKVLPSSNWQEAKVAAAS